MAKASQDPIAFGLVMEMRITEKIKTLTPGSKEMRAALKHVGNLIVLEAQKNIRKKNIVDTERLLSSLRAIITDRGTGLRVGTDVVYAQFHEKGSTAVTDDQRKAIFARLREEGKLGKPSKGLLSGGNFTARPYLGPAVDKVLGKNDINKIIREFLILGG